MVSDRRETAVIERQAVDCPPQVTRRLQAGLLPKLVPLMVSITCLGLLIWLYWGQLPSMLRALRTADPLTLILAWIIKLLSVYVVAARMGVLFRVFGIYQPSHRFFLYTLIGLFFSNFLPTQVGGDVVKASYAAGGTDRTAAAFLATFIDRGIGLIGVLLVGSIGLFFYPSLQQSTHVLLVPVAILAILALLMVVSRVDGWVNGALHWLERISLAERLRLTRVTHEVLRLLRTPGILVLALLLTVASITLASLSLWVMALALHLTSGFVTFLLLIPVITAASLLPSINGVGVREAAFVIVLQGLVAEDQALALALVFYGLGLISSTLGGIVFVLRKPLGLDFSPTILARLRREAS